MYSERVFQIALLVSLLTHAVILSQNANFSLLTQHRKDQSIKIKYVKQQAAEAKTSQKKYSLSKREPFLKLPSKITLQEKLPPPFMDKEDIFRSNNLPKRKEDFFAKPTLISPDAVSIRKKITLPPIEMDNKINNPTYISYYQLVREKIKRAAYQNYIGKEVGEVTISFIISEDGYLKDLRLIEEKSSPSAYLRDIALTSVKDASPFPNFPKELDHPKLSFNLAITFEIE